MLCNFCKSILASQDDEGNKSRSPRELEQAAMSNCYICHCVLAKYRAAGNDLDAEYWDLFFEYEFFRCFPDDIVVGLQIGIMGFPLEIKTMDEWRKCSALHSRLPGTIGIAFVLIPDKCIGPPPPERALMWSPAMSMEKTWVVDHEDGMSVVPSNTGHINVAKLSWSWLKNCQENHALCRKDRNPSFKPKRVLLLGTYVGDHPRLVAGCANYATVSYCWGSSPHVLKLTADNMEEFSKGIPLERFPLTLRQAITTAKRLGIRHLWIDALCIMQDGPGSREDWEEQAGLMGSIYANGIINIGASRAATSDEGMFTQRETRLLHPCRVSRTSPGSRDQNPVEYTAVNIDLYGEQQRFWPTGKRGWIFQERQLAQRMLHFGPEQVHWECKELPHASEMFPGGIQYPSSWAVWGFPKFNAEVERLHDPPYEQLYTSTWVTLVNAYSRMQLTKPEMDKLVAISGMAKLVAERWDDEYVAGIFKKTLPWALLWNVENAAENDAVGEETSSDVYRSPSWSWASTNRPVISALMGAGTSNPVRTLASVTNVDVTLIDPSNPFGRLESASITINGLLLHGKAKTSAKFLDYDHNDFLESLVSFPGGKSVEDIPCRLLFDRFSTYHMEKSSDNGNGFAISVLMVQENDSDPDPNPKPGVTEELTNATGLMLRLVPESLVYERIGVFSATTLIYDSLAVAFTPSTVTII